MGGEQDGTAVNLPSIDTIAPRLWELLPLTQPQRLSKKIYDSMQNTALRIITSARNGTETNILENDCGQMPLKLRRKKQQLQYAAKVKTSSSHPSTDILKKATKKAKNSWKAVEPISIQTEEIFIQQKWTKP